MLLKLGRRRAASHVGGAHATAPDGIAVHLDRVVQQAGLLQQAHPPLAQARGLQQVGLLVLD